MNSSAATPNIGGAAKTGFVLARELLERAAAEGRSALDEFEAKTLLAAYNVCIPPGAIVQTATEAALAVDALGGTVAMKGVGHKILHKSDCGLVVLDIRDSASARAAFRRIVDHGSDRVRGVLVERMVPHERELLVGVRRDERFGPVVAFGLGGIFAEALHDIGFALAPLSERDALWLVGELSADRVLGAVRGLPCVNRQELVHILRALSQMACEHPEIAEVDVNPLIVEGDTLVAADALIVLSGSREVAQDNGESAGATSDISASPRVARLDALLSPHTVAIVGASADETKWGGSLLRNIVEGGFKGSIYPINPRGGRFFGLEVYRSLEALPEIPDLALVAVSAAQSLGVVEDCAKLGMKSVVVIAAGYSEAGDGGRQMESELARAARAADLTVVGPNCMGILTNSVGLNAVGLVSLQPEPGPISIISQSGNVGTQMVMAAERRGIGIEKFVSLGNQAVTNAAEVLDYLADDVNTDAVIMYVEEFADGRQFFSAARRASDRKPVILIHGGSTRAGGLAAASHTGAMAGSAEVFSSAMRQAGAMLSSDPDECLDVAACLVSLPLPRGRQVGVVTLGGGWGVLAADALSRAGLQLAQLPRSITTEIDQLLPPFWSHGNPVDLVASVAGGVAERIIQIVADFEGVDALLVLALVGSPSSGRRGQGQVLGASSLSSDALNEAELSILSCIASTMERTGKPIIAVPLCPIARSVFDGTGTHSPVLLPTPSAAVQALARMVAYAEYRQGRAETKVRASPLNGGTSEA